MSWQGRRSILILPGLPLARYSRASAGARSLVWISRMRDVQAFTATHWLEATCGRSRVHRQPRGRDWFVSANGLHLRFNGLPANRVCQPTGALYLWRCILVHLSSRAACRRVSQASVQARRLALHAFVQQGSLHAGWTKNP